MRFNINISHFSAVFRGGNNKRADLLFCERSTLNVSLETLVTYLFLSQKRIKTVHTFDDEQLEIIAKLF